ncbi:DUF6249 domain-containing protein [Gilvimarinus agarilyticus]|uniref:DUF6249 domain-containing protein n=1 Tax=Gilvimarinus agarilyticus TaxID=679259 RepID=UPI0005A0E247|nr:DUF6249 domain-containing protein [Gilvimarinus agarilyticus]
MSELVPLLAIFMVFSTPVLCLGILMFSLHKRKQLQLEIINRLIESGQPVPEAMFTGAASSAAGGDPLYRRSLYLLWVGGAAFVALFFFAGLDVAALALIPIAMGAVNYKLWQEARAEQQRLGD